MQMINDFSEDFQAAFEFVKAKIVDVSARVNLTMRVITCRNISYYGLLGRIMTKNHRKYIQTHYLCCKVVNA